MHASRIWVQLFGRISYAPRLHPSLSSYPPISHSFALDVDSFFSLRVPFIIFRKMRQTGRILHYELFLVLMFFFSSLALCILFYRCYKYGPEQWASSWTLAPKCTWDLRILKYMRLLLLLLMLMPTSHTHNATRINECVRCVCKCVCVRLMIIFVMIVYKIWEFHALLRLYWYHVICFSDLPLCPVPLPSPPRHHFVSQYTLFISRY